MWTDSHFVSKRCPNENCRDYGKIETFPTRIIYVNSQGRDSVYFDLPMRCLSCGSYFSPESKDCKETDSPVVRMRQESGEVDDTDKLVMLLYLLCRDEIPTGIIDQIIDYKIPKGEGRFTNGWLAEWAKDAAERLKN